MSTVEPDPDEADGPTPTETSVPIGDLADRRAGQGIAEHGKLLRREQPVLSALRRVLRIYVGDGAYRKGAKGERLVGKRLAQLGEEWHVLHSIPIGAQGTDIDHLGHRVWVNTRAIKVDGFPKNGYLSASRSEAAKTGRRLSAACGFSVLTTGVIVVLADDLTVKGMPEETPVLGRKRIAHWLRSQPIRLNEAEIESIFAAARLPTTWK